MLNLSNKFRNELYLQNQYGTWVELTRIIMASQQHFSINEELSCYLPRELSGITMGYLNGCTAKCICHHSGW